jgi:hypothetical protein
MRDLIVSRLNESKIFTDQLYQGSNLSGLTDIVSVIFGSLMFYLNKTSSESFFSESQIYENINRIVKILNYNPAGRFTQNVPITLTASQYLPIGTYVIPRYSYLNLDGCSYSFNQDVFFSKTTNQTEYIENVSNNCLMYQGNFNELPPYTASGIEYETITLPALSDNLSIDHYNIHVYVKNSITNKWIQWERTEDIHNNTPSSRVFEARLNHNKEYEILFGDDINGKKLTMDDTVSVFYLSCKSTAAELPTGALRAGTPLKTFNSLNFSQIVLDLQNISLNATTFEVYKNLEIGNDFPTTNFTFEESVEQIRNNAPKSFNMRKRLVTCEDYQYFISSHFPGLVKDCYVCNNDTFLESHLKYLNDIGISAPYLTKTVLFNQIQFASTCNFNNIYAYLLPQSSNLQSLNIVQKQLILTEANKYKTLTSRIVPMEPVNILLDFYIKNPSIETTIKDSENCRLFLKKGKTANRSSSAIKLEAKAILQDFFSYNNTKLGYFLNMVELTSMLSGIYGVVDVLTGRTDIKTKISQLSFLSWNETYPELDLRIINSNLQFEPFKVVKFSNLENILNKIEVI